MADETYQDENETAPAAAPLQAQQPRQRPAAPPQQPAAPAPKKKANWGKRPRILLIILIIGAGIGFYAWLHRNDIATDDAQFQSTVVSISPKVGGYVVSQPISDNEIVKPGQVLLQIDPTDYKIALERAEANLTAAQAGLEAGSQNLSSTKVSAPGSTESASAQVAQAQASWHDAQLKLKRLQDLTDIARSRQELDDAIAQEQQTKAALVDAQARLRFSNTVSQTVAAAQANAAQRAALVTQAQADIDQAKKNLADTTIISPIAGRVSARGVNIGDFVQPGQQLLSIVGTDFWIVANYKETQLTRIHTGQPVDIKIDAYPDLHLRGKINSIQSGTGSVFSAFPAQNATGNFVKIVQRVPVKITLEGTFDTQRYAIGPGLSVEPVVDVSQ